MIVFTIILEILDGLQKKKESFFFILNDIGLIEIAVCSGDSETKIITG